MEFPYGRAPLAILLLSLTCAAALALIAASSSAQPKPDLVLATFAKEHALAYAPAIAEFERLHGVKIQLQVVSQRALQGRLQAAMQVGADVPDMVELLYGTLGFFTRGPVEDVRFVNLTERVRAEGLHEKLVSSRFGLWSTRGHIFALPHDVHPVMLCYRRDLVEELGIDVSTLTTWEQFVRVGRDRVMRDLDGDGVYDRYMIDLPAEGGDALRLLILQAGGELIDAAGNAAFDSEAAVETVCWYVRQTRGQDRISFPAGWGQNLSRAMIEGLCLFYICPDWRVGQIRNDIPSLQGKLAVMPLPAWEAGGRRTSAWGGTGLAFTRQCQERGKFELAWKLAMHLYYDAAQLGDRFAETNILPPLKDAWDQPEFDVADAFFSGQQLGRLYAALGDQVPEEHSSPYYTLAVGKLSEAYTNTAMYYARHGDTGLHDYARAELKRCADRVRLVMNRNPFLTPAEAHRPAVTPLGRGPAERVSFTAQAGGAAK